MLEHVQNTRCGRYSPSTLPFTTLSLQSHTSNVPTYQGFGEEYTPIVNNDEVFTIFVDVSYFNLIDLVVEVDGPFLCLEAKQESNNLRNFVERSYTSRWTLPTDVDQSAITSSFNDGRLTIKCPKKKETPLIIPIDVIHKNSN
ncbi:unnamed protein product [Auanema sp. JU1783]|nr:unnamed protein product [Auanema sp. JU1783]